MLIPSEITELEATLEGLCPVGLGSACVPADSAMPVASDLEQSSGWSDSRVSEFSGGRFCARQALEQTGWDEEATLERNAEGVPNWPAGYVGSISHCRGLCMAVAAPESFSSAVGLDLERTNRIKEGAARQVVHQLESEFWSGDQLHASILFSLKEAFYKAQFPQWGLAANFQDMALEVDLVAGSARILFLSERLSAGMTGVASRDFLFLFRLVGPHVLSLCWLAD
jgi:4'-phosphopantetheinyl transferase EntD